jgi:phosphate transport system substrate-binding protein
MFSKEGGGAMDILGIGGFWISLVSLLVTLLALCFGIWTYFKSKQRKLISYEFEDKNTNVVSVDRDRGENIEILLDGQPVEEVRYQLIKIRNEGNVAVDDQDYKQPLQIAFAPQAVSTTNQSRDIILRAGIPEAAPALGISSQNAKEYIILDVKNQYVALKDILLNAGDWIKIKVLTREKADMMVRGRIKDGKIRAFTPPRSILTWRRVVGSALVGALLFFLLYNGLGFITGFIQGNCVWSSIEVKGSSAFYAAARGFASDYHSACPVGDVHVDQEPDVTVSLADLKNGTSQVAPSEMPSSFVRTILPDFQDYQVAVIVFTVVISKNVTGIANLSQDQLLKIYNGIYQNWKEVDSHAPNLPIKVFGRPTTSGTYNAFTRYVLGSEARSAPSYQQMDRTDQMAAAVADAPNNNYGAIGYVDEGTASRMSSALTSVEINQQAPTLGGVERNTYPFWAIEHMYTTKNPDKLATSFIIYVTNHVETNSTFIKLQDMPKEILQAHM